MLNISSNSIIGQFPADDFRSFQETRLSRSNRFFVRWLVSALGIFIVFLFLPWTQNVQSKAKLVCAGRPAD